MRPLLGKSFIFLILLSSLIKPHRQDEVVLNVEKVENINETVKFNTTIVEFVQDAKTCSYVSSLKESLTSTESVVLLLKDFLQNAKVKLGKLEHLACESPAKQKSKIEIEKLKSECASMVSNCYEIKEKLKFSASGVYRVWPRYLNRSIDVYCDMETTTGGWTVIQRRTDLAGEQENFYRSWNDYREGFGDIKKEFWLGNDAIFALSNERAMVLRVDMEDFEGTKRYALYNIFRVAPELENYKLKIEGYEGDAGDSFGGHNNFIFHTYDHDRTSALCVQKYKGGWWYDKCHRVNLNGLYLRGNHTSYADGVNWYDFKGYHYSLKEVEMKVRPKLL